MVNVIMEGMIWMKTKKKEKESDEEERKEQKYKFASPLK